MKLTWLTSVRKSVLNFIKSSVRLFFGNLSTIFQYELFRECLLAYTKIQTFETQKKEFLISSN